MTAPLRLAAMAGWGHTAACWERLAVPGTRVEPFSLPGHEPQGGPPPPATLAAGAETLAGDWDLVAGWSLGGLAALEALRRDLIRPGALVLIGTPPSFLARPAFPDGQERAVVEAFRAGLADDLQGTLRRFFALQFRGDRAPRSSWAPTPVRDRYLATGADPGVLADWLDVLAATDLTAAPPGLDLPVLVLHGEADAVVAPSAVDFFRDCGPKVTTHVVSGAGHAPHITHAEDTGQRIGELVRALG